MGRRAEKKSEGKKANNFIILFGLIIGSILLYVSFYKKPLSRLFEEGEIITYQSPHQVREVYVFTDLQCNDCEKFFKNIPNFLDGGITLKIVPYPIDGLAGENSENLERIWCSSNSKEALEYYLESKGVLQNTTCDRNLLENHYKIAQELKVTSVPTIVFNDRKRMLKNNFDNIESTIKEIKEFGY